MTAIRRPPGRSALIVLAAMALLAAVSGSVSCSPTGPPVPTETITIGQNPNETKSLIYIAEERGLFAANGLNVILKDYGTGALAVPALLGGEVDLATCAESVMVGSILRGENIRSIATISKFQNVYVIGRTDRGINSVDDLKDKRIGVARQTSSEFYLGRFLDLQGMNIQQVTLVNVAPAQAVDALAAGSVDAVTVIQPYAYIIRQRLGGGVAMWPAQSGQPTYFGIIGTQAWVESHPEAIRRLLKSLLQAEDFVVRLPGEARVMVQKRLGYEDAYMNEVWPEYQFSVSLDRSLIAAMEDEARWMMRNNLTTEKTVPNFADYIREEGLRALRPAAVNIIR